MKTKNRNKFKNIFKTMIKMYSIRIKDKRNFIKSQKPSFTNVNNYPKISIIFLPCNRIKIKTIWICNAFQHCVASSVAFDHPLWIYFFAFIGMEWFKLIVWYQIIGLNSSLLKKKIFIRNENILVNAISENCLIWIRIRNISS